MLIPPDDGVENLLARIVGLDVVKNHVRGLRRTLEIEQQVLRSEKAAKKYRNATNCNKGVRKIRHLALVGNPGTGTTFVARQLMPFFYKKGAAERDYFLEVGRDDLIDGKSAKRTIEKTRRLMDRAKGGIIFVDEAYTLLPSKARRKTKDHGVAMDQLVATVLIFQTEVETIFHHFQSART